MSKHKKCKCGGNRFRTVIGERVTDKLIPATADKPGKHIARVTAVFACRKCGTKRTVVRSRKVTVGPDPVPKCTCPPGATDEACPVCVPGPMTEADKAACVPVDETKDGIGGAGEGTIQPAMFTPGNEMVAP